MSVWILETVLWALVTVVVCITIWGVFIGNIVLTFGISVGVSLLLGNSLRSY